MEGIDAVADEMVVDAQRWVNETYGGVPGFEPVVEDGLTGWATIHALTRALQHELGVGPLSNNFGSATLSALANQFPVIDGSTARENIVKIVQCGLYCKGYDGSAISGTFGERTAQSVRRLKADMGMEVASPGDGVVPKVFKALLTMDAYVLLSGGGEPVRSAQRWLNGTYVSRRDFFIMPCDGYFSRDVQKALLLAIQFEIGMDDNTANGRFGPGTQAGIREQAVLRTGDVDTTKRFVRLFQAAMIFNRRDVAFSGSYTAQVATAVAEFQRFAGLSPSIGVADYPTWASLLVSTGDVTRRGTACDGITQVTPARAQALRDAGYGVVGRYLTNVVNGTLNKRLQPGEIDDIVDAGLSVFPIYQTYGSSAAYFNAQQGAADALAALDAARRYGFRRGTRIYFAVDFDALDTDVTNAVLPHFRAISGRLAQYGGEYHVGIYGPRNVCSRVGAEGLTSASFVSDMSTGFSGNLGYPLPQDWAFDQISTITVGSGTGQIEIDNNIASGRDGGQNRFDAPFPAEELLDVNFDPASRDALLADLLAYFDTLGVYEVPYVYSDLTPASVDKLLQHDALITGLSRAFKMRKSLIQAPLFWEIRKRTALDAVADLAVRAHYQYLEQLEWWESLSPLEQALVPPPTPVPPRDDASTGLGQIFAATAVDAHNSAISAGLITGTPLNGEDWHVKWDAWRRLNEDPEHNVSTVPLVLIRNADLLGITSDRLAYGDGETEQVLARYNGTGDAAVTYGAEVLGVFDILEKYNAPARNL